MPIGARPRTSWWLVTLLVAVVAGGVAVGVAMVVSPNPPTRSPVPPSETAIVELVHAESERAYLDQVAVIAPKVAVDEDRALWLAKQVCDDIGWGFRGEELTQRLVDRGVDATEAAVLVPVMVGYICIGGR